MGRANEDGAVRVTASRRRPLRVTVLTTLVAIGAFGSFAAGGLAVGPYPEYTSPPVGLTVLLMFVFGLVLILAAIGLPSLTARSWWAAVIAAAAILALSIGLMVFLGRISFPTYDFYDPFLNGLSLGLPIALALLAFIILVSLVVFRRSFGVSPEAVV